jgi:hypothetical protein
LPWAASGLRPWGENTPIVIESWYHLLPDDTIVATTYANYRKEDTGCSIISVRFKISEVDGMAQIGK